MYQESLGGAMVRLWIEMFYVVTLVVIACLILYVFTSKRIFKGIALGGLIIEFSFALFSLFSYFDLKHTQVDIDILYSVVCMEILRLVAIYFLISHKHINTSAADV
ncbi:ATP synthase subunit I [Polynucleobacter sp. 15G-AUS-farblos]|nr:ATP synthase subunit I [Polynucleobacter sp. 15G-AUS-farblos]